jgi:hypothetical protein
MTTKLPPLVYVAGPFRAATPWQIVQNCRSSEEYSLEVWRMGGAAVSPHLNTQNFDKALPDDTFLYGTEAMLRACAAMLLIPGWQNSSGSLHELDVAREMGIPVFNAGDPDPRVLSSLVDLHRWLNERK